MAEPVVTLHTGHVCLLRPLSVSVSSLNIASTSVCFSVIKYRALVLVYIHTSRYVNRAYLHVCNLLSTCVHISSVLVVKILSYLRLLLE